MTGSFTRYLGRLGGALRRRLRVWWVARTARRYTEQEATEVRLRAKRSL